MSIANNNKNQDLTKNICNKLKEDSCESSSYNYNPIISNEGRVEPIKRNSSSCFLSRPFRAFSREVQIEKRN